MRMQPQTITLGDHRWQIRPLTLAQVQAVEPLLFASGANGGTTVASAVAVLRVALSRDHAEAAATLDEVEAGAPEIAAALAKVLRLGGFVPEDLSSGESAAAVGEAGPSIGAASTPG